MHNAVFSILFALVTTCVTALASSSLPSKAAEDEQPGMVQPADSDDAEKSGPESELPFRAD
ncbi:hypothetical protein [Antarcticirhabdus aurantiaca]|uniref:Uncharacterized protein n=1 Tax=Antarcticirhabdus aurantiaca TaxID=2606717 RepID=A0ACD4NVY7_9HYPH|nr:hypothetical protein [Antarcticirhabdus aurantiaca]WAJ30933.1 hypothetical protein OXU80_12320 [Jeongeuplla avenae]